MHMPISGGYIVDLPLQPHTISWIEDNALGRGTTLTALE